MLTLTKKANGIKSLSQIKPKKRITAIDKLAKLTADITVAGSIGVIFTILGMFLICLNAK